MTMHPQLVLRRSYTASSPKRHHGVKRDSFTFVAGCLWTEEQENHSSKKCYNSQPSNFSVSWTRETLLRDKETEA